MFKSWSHPRAGERLTPKPALHFETQTDTKRATFDINEKTDQTIVGFGASFLEAGMICLNSLDLAGQESVLRALFDHPSTAGNRRRECVWIGGIVP